jgi:hypothetical protein
MDIIRGLVKINSISPRQQGKDRLDLGTLGEAKRHLRPLLRCGWWPKGDLDPFMFPSSPLQ